MAGGKLCTHQNEWHILHHKIAFVQTKSWSVKNLMLPNTIFMVWEMSQFKVTSFHKEFISGRGSFILNQSETASLYSKTATGTLHCMGNILQWKIRSEKDSLATTQTAKVPGECQRGSAPYATLAKCICHLGAMLTSVKSWTPPVTFLGSLEVWNLAVPVSQRKRSPGGPIKVSLRNATKSQQEKYIVPETRKMQTPRSYEWIWRSPCNTHLSTLLLSGHYIPGDFSCIKERALLIF